MPLEDTDRIARRVLGGENPTTVRIEVPTRSPPPPANIVTTPETTHRQTRHRLPNASVAKPTLPFLRSSCCLLRATTSGARQTQRQQRRVISAFPAI